MGAGVSIRAQAVLAARQQCADKQAAHEAKRIAKNKAIEAAGRCCLCYDYRDADSVPKNWQDPGIYCECNSWEWLRFCGEDLDGNELEDDCGPIARPDGAGDDAW